MPTTANTEVILVTDSKLIDFKELWYKIGNFAPVRIFEGNAYQVSLNYRNSGEYYNAACRVLLDGSFCATFLESSGYSDISVQVWYK